MHFYYRLALTTATIAGLAACSGPFSGVATQRTSQTIPAVLRPSAAAVTARVTYHNKLDKPIALWAEYSYDGWLRWYVYRSACVAPGGSWNTDVVYDSPDKGPQIRMYAIVYKKPDCSDFFSVAKRFVAFKNIVFQKGEAFFKADVFESPNAYEMCAEGGGNAQKCDLNPNPPDKKNITH